MNATINSPHQMWLWRKACRIGSFSKHVFMLADMILFLNVCGSSSQVLPSTPPAAIRESSCLMDHGTPPWPRTPSTTCANRRLTSSCRTICLQSYQQKQHQQLLLTWGLNPTRPGLWA